ncbi:adenosine deaminase [Bifidobacterium choloepi]|uniref:Adenine deaminase n=1 Tax=Bifidobacterium choloepi TaxID=2614131 RepID=A0A6I5NBY1_9BIFI|nr:adenosine deaminase [Bifidobacterium choloepi]NEG69074.1 adenosine deaminase [Bifidobacterium choloepi]
MVDSAIAAAIRTLPKAELHLHIEGTLEPALALELAARNGVELPWTNVDDLAKQYEFEDLQSFLNLYYQLMAVLKTEDDFRDLMLANLRHAAEDGVRHAEIFFDPQVHMKNGTAFETVLNGLKEGARIGRERYGVTVGLIMSVVRDESVASADELIDVAAPYANDILGIGLDSAEVGFPPHLFEDVYRKAKELGWHRVAHAGEEGPVGYIEEALDLLHVERIDHGTHAADSPAMMERLAAEGIGLTSCPLSNLRLNVVDKPSDLPILEFMNNDMAVTINSDDPAYFGGYIAANYDILVTGLGLKLDDLARLAGNSLAVSFITEEERAALFAELEDWKTEHLG